MKQYDFYTKCKINYPPAENLLFTKKNWWQIGLSSVITVLSGPLMVYKLQRSIPFTLLNYLRLAKYYFVISIPLLAVFAWVNWREYVKRSRGYHWVGKFDVVKKRSSFLFCYLLLAPGESEVKVSRGLFEKTQIGDSVVVQRDALGGIETVSREDNFAGMVAKAAKAAQKRM